MIAYNKLRRKWAKDYLYIKSIVHQTSKNPMRSRIYLSNKYLGEIVFSWLITAQRVVGHFFLSPESFAIHGGTRNEGFTPRTEKSLSRRAPWGMRVVIFVSRAFRSTNLEKRETAATAAAYFHSISPASWPLRSLIPGCFLGYLEQPLMRGNFD